MLPATFLNGTLRAKSILMYKIFRFHTWMDTFLNGVLQFNLGSMEKSHCKVNKNMI